MGISLGGIMRGGLPVLSDRLRRNENIKETAILKIGEKFGQLKNKVDEADAKNRAYMSDVESVANSMNMEKDIVYNVFKVYGGKNKSSLNHLNNLYKSFTSKGQNVPTMAMKQTEQMLPKKEDATISVDASKDDKDMNVFDKAMSLFKTAGPDEIFKEFMKRNPQLNEAEVRKIMSNTMNPVYSPSSQIDPEAFVSTMGTMKEPKPIDKYKLTFERFKDIDKKLLDNPEMFNESDSRYIKSIRQPFDLLRQHIDDGNMEKAEQQYNFIIGSGFNDIATFKPAEEEKDKKIEIYSLAFDRFSRFENLMITKPEMFDDGNTQTLKDLREPFTLLKRYVDEGDLENAEKIYNTITTLGFNDISSVTPKGTDKAPGNYEITNQLIRKQMPGMSEEFYKNKTNELMTTKTLRTGNKVFQTKIKNGELVLEEMHLTGADGIDRISNAKIFEENKTLIQKGTQNLQKIFSLRNVLKKYPNAFSIEGKIRMAVGGALDMIGQGEYVKRIGADKIFQSVQDRTSFVSSVKDELFDDPRLSDQDLRLVLNYIAILDNPIVGPVMSRAALIGIEKAMLNSMAVRIAQNYPTLPAFNRVVKDGVTSGAIDFSKNSVAKMMLTNLMSAEYGMNYERDFASGKIKSEDYKTSILTNYTMVKNSLSAVSAYQSHQRVSADTPFKYKSENLFNVRNLKQFKELNIEDHEERFKKLEAEYKERQRLRKLRLEN